MKNIIGGRRELLLAMAEIGLLLSARDDRFLKIKKIPRISGETPKIGTIVYIYKVIDVQKKGESNRYVIWRTGEEYKHSKTFISINFNFPGLNKKSTGYYLVKEHRDKEIFFQLVPNPIQG